MGTEAALAWRVVFCHQLLASSALISRVARLPAAEAALEGGAFAAGLQVALWGPYYMVVMHDDEVDGGFEGSMWLPSVWVFDSPPWSLMAWGLWLVVVGVCWWLMRWCICERLQR